MLSRRRAALGIAVLAVLVLAAAVRPARAFALLRGVLFGPWFPAVLVALYLVRPFLGWPVVLLSALVGFRYGVLVGLPVALVGAVATSLVPYGAARRLDMTGAWLSRFRGGSERYFTATGGFRGVVAARLVPTPAEAVSGAAGAAGVPLAAFVAGTLVGELPWTVAAVLVGSSLEAFAVGAAEVDWRLVVSLAVAGLALLAGPAYRAWRERRAGPE